MKPPSKRKRDAERAADRKERKLAEKARARRAEIESTTAERKAVRGRGEDGSEYDKQLAYLYGGEYEVATRDESGEGGSRVDGPTTDSLRGDRRRVYELVPEAEGRPYERRRPPGGERKQQARFPRVVP